MKKNKLLIFSILSFVIAGITFGIAAGLGFFNRQEWENANAKIRAKVGMLESRQERIYEEENEVTSLKLDIKSSNLIIQKGDVDKITVKYFVDYEDEEINCNYSDNVLTITENIRDWNFTKEVIYFDLQWVINVFDNSWSNYTTTVTIPNDLVLENLDISNSSGNLNIYDAEAENITLKISSGYVNVKNMITKNLSGHITSGGLDIKNSVIDNKLDLRMSSGDIEIEDTDIKDINLRISSGDTEFENVKSEKVDIYSASGKIEFNRSDIVETIIESKSGRVEITNHPNIKNEYDCKFNIITTSSSANIFGAKHSGGYNNWGIDSEYSITAKLASSRFIIS